MSSGTALPPPATPAALGRAKSSLRIFLLLGLLLVLALGLSLSLGAVTLTPTRLLEALLHSNKALRTDLVILWDLRVPRALLSGLVGAALAVAGGAFQGLFRNPLADPYVIGASSGAAFGATVAITFGFTANVAGVGALPFAAFAGALLTVALVYLIAETGGHTSIASLLLAGSALSAMLSALVSFLMIWQEQPWFYVFSWLLGGFSGRSWPQLWSAGPFLLLGMTVLWLLARPLDALAGGDELAQSLGLRLRTTRLLIVSAAALIVAAAVSVSGIIGFIGLIAPHCARWLCGAGHSRLLPASALLGALLLVLADTAARTLLAPVEIPVGILTAALGGPFFLYLLRARTTHL